MYIQHLFYVLITLLFNIFLIFFGVISPIGLVNLIVVGIPHLRDTIFVIIQVLCKPCVKKITEEDIEHKVTRNILCLVPTYKEDIREVSATLDSLIEQKANEFVNKRIIMICDGYFKYEEIFSSMYYIESIKYTTFMQKSNQATIHFCTYKENDVIVIIKRENGGKKDSWILVHNIFLGNNFADLRKTLLRGMKLPSVNYIFNTDADSVITSDTLLRQSRIMASNRNIAAVAGLVLTPIKYRFWTMFQGFQYFYGQLIRRMAESHWGKPSCLPGCVSMINLDHQCVLDALNDFKKLPEDNSLFHIKHRLQGTDRRFTNCLLQYSKNVRIVTDRKSYCYTIPPQSLRHFQSQRKRWTSNVITGNYYLLFGKNIPWYTRFLSAVDLFRIHTCISRLFSSFMLWIHIADIKIWQLVGILLMFIIPYVYFLYHALKLKEYRKFLLLGSLVSKLVSPFITVYVFIYSIIHFSDNSWGRTHGTAPSETSKLLHYGFYNTESV